MSKTHSNEITASAKKVARWLSDRLKSAASAPTTTDIMTRVHTTCPSPKFSTEDQVGVGRAALTFLKRDDLIGWEKFQSQNPDVEDRAAAPLVGRGQEGME